MGSVAAGRDEPTGVAERCQFSIAGMRGDFNALPSFVNFDEAIDKENGWRCHFQSRSQCCGTGGTPPPGPSAVPVAAIVDVLSAVDVQASQGHGVAVGLQTDGTLQLLLYM